MNCDDTYYIVGIGSNNYGADYYLYQGPKSATPYVRKGLVPLISAYAPDGGGGNSITMTPIWHTKNPNRLFVMKCREIQRTQGRQLYIIDINPSTGAMTPALVHTFDKDPNMAKWFQSGSENYITWEEYGEPSMDMKIWAFNVKTYTQGMVACATYRLDESVYPPTLTQIAYTEDSTKLDRSGNNKGLYGVSPKGTSLIHRCPAPVGGTYYGVFDIYFNWKYRFHAGHFDIGLDAEGREVAAGIVQGDQHGEDYFAWLDLEDGTMYGAVLNDYTTGVGTHNSCHTWNKPGWMYINSYQTQGRWGTDQIFAVEMNRVKALFKIPWDPGRFTHGNIQYLNPSQPCRVFRIAHHHIYTVPGNYTNQAHGGISLSGNYFIYWGSWEVDEFPNNEVYMVALPPTWYQDLKGNIQSKSDITPPSIPTGIKIIK
jgi:hypothetical protein